MSTLYTPEIEKKLALDYQADVPIKDLAEQLQVPERSVIAKLASMGIYKKKVYLNKQGNLPIKKEQYIEMLAQLLQTEADRLESLEKANKSVLAMLVAALSADK